MDQETFRQAVRSGRRNAGGGDETGGPPRTAPRGAAGSGTVGGGNLCAKLSVRQGRDQVPILRAESPRSVAVSSRLGVRFPVIEGSVGAALLFKTPDAEIAALAAECSEPVMEKNHPEIVTARIDALRLRGFCFNAGVNRWKIDAMSVPVLDGEKQVAAALTLLGSEEDFRERALPGLGAALRKAAKECARLVE